MVWRRSRRCWILKLAQWVNADNPFKFSQLTASKLHCWAFYDPSLKLFGAPPRKDLPAFHMENLNTTPTHGDSMTSLTIIDQDV